MNMNRSLNRRILIIDDNCSIHEDFRRILGHRDSPCERLEATEAFLFGTPKEPAPTACFEVESAFQGEEGLERVMSALQDGCPFAVAFVDIRMPPGWDGVETIERIWQVDPDVQIVICSAYSDYTAQEILSRLGVSDQLLMLRKPCDSAEILLMATALCHKWNLARTLVEAGA
jgi:CheY-like chemotaxis protein